MNNAKPTQAGPGTGENGVYTSIAGLIQLRHASRELDPAPASRARNPLSGLLSSRFKGRGIDFAEVRNYQPGDDVRSIDWRVTARTGHAHTKLFQEERERPVLILVDQSQSMFFGTRVAFKSVTAARTAAVLAWSALNRGDRVGGLVFAEDGHREIRPRRSRHSVLRLLNEINDFNRRLQPGPVDAFQQDATTAFTQALGNLRRVARHGCAVYIISDFSHMDDAGLTHLSQLARGNDLVGIHISDALERSLPRPDWYTVTNGEQRLRIDTHDHQFRQDYQTRFEQQLANTRAIFNRNKSRLLVLQNHEPLVDSLAGQTNELTRAG